MVAIKLYRENAPKQPRKIICQRCSTVFYTSKFGQGRTKYCIECGIKVREEKDRYYNKLSQIRRRRKS